MAVRRRIQRAAAAAVLLLPSAAAAQTSASAPIEIHWRAVDGCPSAESVRSEIDRLLGGAPERAAKRVVARAEVTRLPSGRLRLDVRTDASGAVGERSLEDDDCAALAQATSLIVALAFDPAAVAATQRQPPAGPAPTAPAGDTSPGSAPPAAATGAPAQLPPAAAPKPAPPAARARPTGEPASPGAEASQSEMPGGRFFVGAAVSGDAGALPAPAGGLTVLGGVRVARWMRAELAGTYWFGQRASLDTRPGAGGDFEFLSASVTGCPTLPLGEVEVGGCAGLELGRMSATGFGVDDPGDGTVLWAALRAGAYGAWLVSPLVALRGELGAAVPVERRRWVLDRVGEVDRPGPVTARGIVGAELRF